MSEDEDHQPDFAKGYDGAEQVGSVLREGVSRKL